MTAGEAWDWVVRTDAGLLTRVAVGAAIFAGLAYSDWRRNGRAATRWREYSFLLAMVGIVLAYGVVNDQVTSAISWEYFYYGKGLDGVLGDRTPPDAWRLHWEAAKVGMKATWSAGLIVGVALLIANNPWRGRRRLAYRRLFARVPVMLGVTVAVAGLFGGLGYMGVFTRFSEDFRQMLLRDEFRPRRFMAVFGIHLGGYAGGLVAMGLAVMSVVRERTLNHGEHQEHQAESRTMCAASEIP